MRAMNAPGCALRSRPLGPSLALRTQYDSFVAVEAVPNTTFLRGAMLPIATTTSFSATASAGETSEGRPQQPAAPPIPRAAAAPVAQPVGLGFVVALGAIVTIAHYVKRLPTLPMPWQLCPRRRAVPSH